ncbi:MAG: c-type cytochrome [Bacteroidia bacterium]
MKTTILQKTFLALGLVGGTALIMSSTVIKPEPTAAWVAPALADTIKNPLKGKADATAAGKKIYATYCVPCHGEKGRGDGVAASALNPRPADHTSERVQRQTDGAIYWKLTTGRSPMASYANTLTVTQRWQVIDYIRTLAKDSRLTKKS